MPELNANDLWDGAVAVTKFTKFTNSFFKVDETNHTVSGLITNQTLDKTGEQFDFDSSLPFYKEWSAEIAKASQGKSLGNIREMHRLDAVGKLIEINYDETNKAITGVAKIIDDNTWKKCVEGVLTGFSHGGEYVKVWNDGNVRKYTARPSEVSVVDNPCNPSAVFEYVKADGSHELRKFVSGKGVETVATPVVVTNSAAISLSKADLAEIITEVIKAVTKKSCPKCGKDMEDCKCEMVTKKTEDDKCKDCGKDMADCTCSSKVTKGKCKDCGKDMKDCSCEKVKKGKCKQCGKDMADCACDKSAVKKAKEKSEKEELEDKEKRKEEDTKKLKAATDQILRNALKNFYDLTDVQVEKLFEEPAEGSKVKKGLHQVKELSRILMQMATLHWEVSQEEERENDEASVLPEQLLAQISTMADSLVAMATEETKELVEDAKAGIVSDDVLWGAFWCALAEGDLTKDYTEEGASEGGLDFFLALAN